MPNHRSVERTILVFCVWGSLGCLGAAGLIEGFSRDSLSISLLGLVGIFVAFIAHIVVNAVFDQGFTRGEVALGIGAFGLFALIFIVAWLAGMMSRTDYLSALAAFAAIVVGFFAYLTTRHGLRGAFSQFHHPHAPGNGERRR